MSWTWTGGGIVPGTGAAPAVRVRSARDPGFGLRALIAPGPFKGSLTAGAAAEAMRRGVQRASRRLGAPVLVDVCPVSDGGGGFVRAMVRATGGELRETEVWGPVGERALAEWGVLSRQGPESADVPVGRAARHAVESALDLPSGSLGREQRPLQPWKTAVLEAASCVGLELLGEEDRDPHETSSFGLGELIAAALDAGCGRVIVGLGNTATVDGGLGVARALGVRLSDEKGRPVTSGDRPRPTGADLGRVAHVAVNTRDGRLEHVRVTVAADVDAPLLGERGAARVFGPQKGATAEQVKTLEAGLANLARRCGEAGLDFDPATPGAGAGGGLGYGLAALCGGEIVPGAGLVLDAVRFDERAGQADVVLTGEGRLDAQTTGGKLVGAVSGRARAAGAMPIALVGSAGEGADRAAEAVGLQAYRSITPAEAPEGEAMRFAADLLEAETERTFLAAMRG